jgi:hypothetical protein
VNERGFGKVHARKILPGPGTKNRQKPGKVARCPVRMGKDGGMVGDERLELPTSSV